MRRIEKELERLEAEDSKSQERLISFSKDDVEGAFHAAGRRRRRSCEVYSWDKPTQLGTRAETT